MKRTQGLAHYDLEERRLVKAVLKAANLVNPTAENLYELASPFIDGDVADWGLREKGPAADAILAPDHARLCGRLSAICGDAADQATLDEIREDIGRTVFKRYVPQIRDMSLIPDTVPVRTGIEGFFAYGLLLLLDHARPFGYALRRCGFCKQWFLALRTGKGGRPPNYCSRVHQHKWDKLQGPKRAAERRRRAKAAKHK